VDFVIRGGDRVVPVEVKYRHKPSRQLQLDRSLRNFITLDFTDSLQLDQTKVSFIPFTHLYNPNFPLVPQ
jgi:hypothetical protein